MKRIRLIGILLILTLVVTLLPGCSNGKHSIQNGNITAEEGLLQGDYGLFTGNYLRNIKLQEGTKITFGYAVGTLSGELTAYLLDPNDNTKNIIEDNFVYEIEKSGTYKIEVVGNDHSGAFALEWEIN
jgi:hypothetical protein